VDMLRLVLVGVSNHTPAFDLALMLLYAAVAMTLGVRAFKLGD